MPILKFMFATLVTALCLDSVFTHAMVLRNDRDGVLVGIVLIFCAKLVVSSFLVGMALWIRSAWRGWHG